MNISDNPFFTLGVSTRDNRRQITAAAEEKTFVSGSDFGEARTALLIPEKRIAAEVRWFPGMDDAKVREISEFFRNVAAGNYTNTPIAEGLRSLARLNFSVYMFSYRKFAGVSDMAGSILAICSCFDNINTEGVCASINNDRLIAGFPMTDEAEFERALNDYRADILGVIDGRLPELSREEYTGLATELAVKYADANGEYYGSILLGDFLAGYELNILPRLDEHMMMIRSAASNIRDFLPGTVLAELSRCLKEWRKLSDPLLTAESVTGIENGNIRGQAGEIFGVIRERAIALHNEHDKTSEALRLIKTVIDGIFVELSRAISRDVRELEELERKKRNAEEEYNAWARSLYYETEFGLIFKDKLRISADGISWKGVNTPLDEVQGISWGGIRQHVNGMYMRTDYIVTILTPYSTIKLTPKEDEYEKITSHLWRALIGPISTRILSRLQNGELLYFGNIKVKDDGVYLKKSGWFSSDVRFFGWQGIMTYSNNGQLFITSGDYSASASYIDDMNTHILEAILRQFRSSRYQRLSGLLS